MSTPAPVVKDRKNLVLFLVGGLLVTLGLALFVSPLASSSPDGLEKVAQEQGFADSAQQHTFGDSQLADYGGGDGVPTGVAGAIGVVVTFGAAMIVFGLIRVLAGRERASDDAPPGP